MSGVLVAPLPPAAAPTKASRPGPSAARSGLPLSEAIVQTIDDAKGADILTIDLAGKTALADAMIIASGTSDRHVGAIAERVMVALKEHGLPAPRVEGMPVCDWVLIDAGDVIVHLFRPEVRGFYNLEKLWGLGRPVEGGPAEPTPEKPRARVRRATPLDAPARPRPKRAKPE